VSSVRGVLAAVRAGLVRTLAEDDDRVAYWVRHVRYGVLLSEIAGLAVLVYTLLTPTPIHGNPLILVLAAGVLAGSPVVLLLPYREWVRDHRGPVFFYAWSFCVMVLITVAARADGGAGSPISAVLFLTLAFMAATYPPYGVAMVGALMTADYLLFIALPDLTAPAAFFAVVMASFTMICTMASANTWAAYDRQALLIRTQEMLAATDPLTGIPNRRAFLDRVGRAVSAAAWGHQTVVCLVDLDGFKQVNDQDGHAAGDAVLTAIGSALGATVRETDTVARLGGDEFAVLADISVTFSGEMLAERLRAAVAATGRRYGVTASVGVAEIEPGDDVEDLMHRADAAMYRSKAAGGNRVTALSS
jgi:diguanylate cyclase (GGDEF)-like protein